jgi:hypothetical protein
MKKVSINKIKIMLGNKMKHANKYSFNIVIFFEIAKSKVSHKIFQVCSEINE